MEKVGDPGRQRHPQHPSSLRRRTGSRVGIYFGTLAFLLVLSAIDLVKTSSMLRKVHGIIAKELKTDAPCYVGVPNNPTSNNDIDGDNVHGGEGKEIPVVVSPPSSHDADHDFRKRFEYDVERWNKHKPKIVILVGPHKTASSTLQTFLTQLAGQTIALGTDETTETTETEIKSNQIKNNNNNNTPVLRIEYQARYPKKETKRLQKIGATVSH
mmetsp:Transcript_5981/g.17013  ORF Transcript_5981/g.17013 Transcript_5981/m.17013 type:complete len:213 (-) Transcript_5981:30-668(-)